MVIKSGSKVADGSGSVLLDIVANVTPISCSIDDAADTGLSISQRMNQINRVEGGWPNSAGESLSTGIVFFLGTFVTMACASFI